MIKELQSLAEEERDEAQRAEYLQLADQMEWIAIIRRGISAKRCT